MILNEILQRLNIKAEFIGCQEFDTMGLVETKCGQRVCSFIDDIKYKNQISSDIKLLITTKETGERLQGNNICIVDNPRIVFFMVHNYLTQEKRYIRKDKPTTIGKGCNISKLAYIAEKNVAIGDNVVIEEFVSIKENVIVGTNTIIRAGTIVGGEGFEQKRFRDGVMSVKHAGGVVIGRNVELQQSNTVDKAIYPWDDTLIDDNCKTDNMVHIAHAVKMHKSVFVAASTCIAGRVILEDDVWVGPGVTLINGMHIGKGARVNIGSVATRDVPEGCAVTGNFAIDHSKFINNLKEIR